MEQISRIHFSKEVITCWKQKHSFSPIIFSFIFPQNQKLALACTKDVCLKTVLNARKSKKILTCVYRCYRRAHPHIVWVSELIETFPETKKIN